MVPLVATFTLGLLGSAHCVGMCGGFAAAIAATRQPFWPSFARQLVYSSGRLTTYAFLGAAGGFAGQRLAVYDTALVTVQQVFSILAGVVMLVIGASVLGLLRLRWVSSLGLGALFAPAFAHFLNARSLHGFFLAGLANGFLPCGLVYAFLAQAVATGHLGHGALLMFAFGLGTVPAMVGIGCGSVWMGHAMRKQVYRFAACLVIVMGGVTVWRSWPSPDGGACCDHTATPTMDRAPAGR